jgi:hypothetical protein
MAALFEIYSLNDCAAELLLANRDKLRGHVNCDELLELLTPFLGGRNVGYQPYMKAYFEPDSAVVANPASLAAVKIRTSRLKNLLRRRLPPRLKTFLRGLIRT